MCSDRLGWAAVGDRSSLPGALTGGALRPGFVLRQLEKEEVCCFCLDSEVTRVNELFCLWLHFLIC